MAMTAGQRIQSDVRTCQPYPVILIQATASSLAYSAADVQQGVGKTLTWKVTPQNFAMQVSNLFLFQLAEDQSQGPLVTSEHFVITYSTGNDSSVSTTATTAVEATSTSPSNLTSVTGPESPVPSSSRSANNGLGLGLGLGLGIPGLAVLCLILYFQMRRQKSSVPAQGSREKLQGGDQEYLKPELDSAQRPVELAARDGSTVMQK